MKNGIVDEPRNATSRGRVRKAPQYLDAYEQSEEGDSEDGRGRKKKVASDDEDADFNESRGESSDEEID